MSGAHAVADAEEAPAPGGAAPGTPAPDQAAAGRAPWMRRVDVVVLAGLVAVPLLVYGVPALLGHLMLPGDDLTQNFPLRVLVGTDLRHGHLPLWNPYLWSGTPLLAGFNAGALSPPSWLFAALPARAAWPLNLIFTYAVAATGMYVFLRRRHTGPFAGAAGAAAFAFAGFMAGQSNHLGLIQGMAWTGWLLVFVDRSSERCSAPATVAGLGGVAGLVLLSGEPRAVSNVAIVAVLYAAWRWWHAPGDRARLAAVVVAGAAVGVMIGAAQFVPGLLFEGNSQRSATSLAAYGAGSLRPGLLLLGIVPFLAGGFGRLGTPIYSADYNLPEVTSYVGLIAVSGALSLVAGRLARLRHRRARRPAGGWGRRWRDPGPGSQVAVWGLVAAVGVVLALGGFAPVADVLWRVPVFGGQRLPSRNIAIADTAVAVLFALWAEAAVRRRPRTAEVIGALLAPVAVLGVVATALLWPGGLGGIIIAGSPLIRSWPFLAVSAILAAAAVVLVLAWRRGLAGRLFAAGTAALLAVDLGFFALMTSSGWTAASNLPAPTSPGVSALSALLAPGERIALIDPTTVYAGYQAPSPAGVPVPDLVILGDLHSVQGYSSIVSALYAGATASHNAGTLDPAVLDGPLADELALRVVLTLPGYVEAPGPLRTALSDPRWRPAGQIDGLDLFVNRHRLDAVHFVPPPGTALPLGATPSYRQEPWGDATVVVDAPAGGTLVRSEAWSAGWWATASRVAPAAGAAPGGGIRLAVQRRGLAQAVTIPPGEWRVVFHYRSRGVTAGLATGGAGLAALAGFSLWGLACRRRRRPRSAPAPR